MNRLTRLSPGPDRSSGPDGFWQERIGCFVAALQPVLAWARAGKRLSWLEIDLYQVVQLRGIERLSEQRMLPVGTNGGTVELTDLPDGLIEPLRQYLYEIPGYDPALSGQRQRSPEPERQHALVLFVGRDEVLARLMA